jgi:2-iminobutanoate/2-iminopropanoate deaminase
MAKKELIYVKEGHQHTSPIPQGVKAGGFIFLSALRGVATGSTKPPEDLDLQVSMLFENMKSALASAGATLDDVVRVAIYMTDLQEGRKILNKHWAANFGDNTPSRFAVEVTDMGGPDDFSKVLAEVIAIAP